MTVTPMQWTVHDYHRLIDAGILDNRQVELLNGEIIEMSPEGPPHASLSSRAADYLRAVLKSYPILIREGKPITLPTSEPELDIAIVRYEEDYYWEHHPYPEDVFAVIEYSNSSLNKDLEIKSKVYAAANISEYWVVNLREMKLVVFRSPDGGDYQEKSTLIQGTICPIAFPEVAVEVARFIKR